MKPVEMKLRVYASQSTDASGFASYPDQSLAITNNSEWSNLVTTFTKFKVKGGRVHLIPKSPTQIGYQALRAYFAGEEGVAPTGTTLSSLIEEGLGPVVQANKRVTLKALNPPKNILSTADEADEADIILQTGAAACSTNQSDYWAMVLEWDIIFYR